MNLEEIQKILRYEPDTGDFYYVIKRGSRRIGDKAGLLYENGYIRIEISGKRYLSHRLAWLFCNKSWPTKFIDHINGDRSDNRIVNLREADQHQNQYNSKKHKDNTTGYKNIRLHRDGKYEVRISVKGKRIQIGSFKTVEEAAQSYNNAVIKYHAEFAYRE
jgi:hypothetical protein